MRGPGAARYKSGQLPAAHSTALTPRARTGTARRPRGLVARRH